jgi:hypothetical protein
MGSFPNRKRFVSTIKTDMNRASKISKFDMIPVDLIESWIRGEYLLGTARTVGYDYIGWSLFARGYYRYRVDGERGGGEPNLVSKGFCIIDVRDGELALWGIRTETNDPVAAGTYSTAFFRSEFSRLTLPRGVTSSRTGASSPPIVYFGSRFYTIEMKKQEDERLDQICRRKRDVCERAERCYSDVKKQWKTTTLPTESAGEQRTGRNLERSHALQSYQHKVYEYLTDQRLFDKDYQEIQAIFDEYDAETDPTNRRNLYAIIQLYLDQGNRDRLRADFDRVQGGQGRAMHGALTLERINVLELME